jgi:CheY-like chemotaxis protein
MLEKLGHTVTIAADGLKALEAWERQLFDVVLMDVQMPQLDGFEATAAIRQREAHLGRRTPIVALTAHAMKGDRERCLAAGMDDYVTKPIQVEELTRALLTVPAGTAAGDVTTPPGTATVSPIDRVELLDRIGQDLDLLREVVDIWRTDAPRLVHELRSALASGDVARVTRAAHTIKGAVGSFGAFAAMTTAGGLEAFARAGDLPAAIAAIPTLEAELGRLQPALDELLDELLSDSSEECHVQRTDHAVGARG